MSDRNECKAAMLFYSGLCLFTALMAWINAWLLCVAAVFGLIAWLCYEDLQEIDEAERELIKKQQRAEKAAREEWERMRCE